MRLIDADALKEALKSNCDLCHDKNTNWCEHCCPLNDFEDLIDNAPTVEERPQGEWIEENSETGALGIKYTWFKCNQCGWDSSLVIPKNFCPNCGAKMKGGAE